ncbi:abortive infection system antitoxin AbiGi family protein [Flavobacterium granuli]|uniref:Abortive phage resistance protein AbiGi (Putative antitoxin) n=1 Tax=Flavobacterium granuli TaxID=280093 RepID=A0A1M5U8I7_9FLAO|nr:abortive infection system antitoxin AbiGi family protein [Flavobacterium granuli]PRZ19381.1 abortive phage resistance protein AbiGi (putative antitoxin) [Flavobacterium granuli]SHH59240.1 Putative abortive phage resistance protein AbiGi, antitoxin [Flavobacterium granuli]
MAISTNSIIHYTDSFNILALILKEGFKIKYCAEILKLDDGTSNAAHPMISFCDIPLSDSKQHFNAYGKYGIGLTKNWAVKNGVNPVLYIDSNSLFAKSLHELIKERRKKDTNLTSSQARNILKIKAYAKNYSGHLKRKSVDISNYKYYDEREWRLVPESSKMNNATFSLDLASYNKSKETYNEKISDCRFTFKSNDISYIIVEHTSEIPKMINVLRTEYSEKCTAKELDILFSKICSTEQIIADY